MDELGKKGEERIVSFWWIFVGGIIVLFIVLGTIAYYSEIIDSRAIEADILANKVVGCISDKVALVFKDGFDIYSECNLNDLGTEGKKEYYIGFNLYSIDSCKFIGKSISCGNPETTKFYRNYWQDYCDLQKEKGMQRKLPQCSEKYIYVTQDNQEKIMRITAASNQKLGEIWKN